MVTARQLIEAENPKSVLRVATDQAKAEYEPTEFERGVLSARDSKRDLHAQRYAKVKELRDQGLSFAAIGKQFGVGPNFIRTIYLRGQRAARRGNTPEEQLSVRAVNWLSSVLDVDISQPGWGREAARKLAETPSRKLMQYRNFGPKLYVELRHWAQANYGAKLAQPDEMSSLSSTFNRLIPKAPNYEI